MKPLIFVILTGGIGCLVWSILMSDMVSDLDTSPSFTFIDRFNLFTYPAVIGSVAGIFLGVLLRSTTPLIATIGASLITLLMYSRVFDASHGNPGYMFPAAHIAALLMSAICYLVFLIFALVFWAVREHRLKKQSEQSSGEESPTRSDSTTYDY